MTGHRTTPSSCASAPVMRMWIPTAALHLLHGGTAVILCLLIFESRFWLGFGLLLCVTSVLFPNQVSAWWVLLFLALGQLWRMPSAFDPTFHLLLAGGHFVHVLGHLVRHLPWRGRMEVAALASPFARFTVIQVMSQLVAMLALQRFGSARGSIPGLSLLAATMLATIALTFSRRIRVTATHG